MNNKALIVYYTLGGKTKRAADEIAAGLREAGYQVTVKTADTASNNDIKNNDLLIFGTPDYFSYMAGGLKDFFDRCWYTSRQDFTGKPYAAFVTCGGPGLAIKSMVHMCRRFGLKRIRRPIIVTTPLQPRDISRLNDFGREIALAARTSKRTPTRENIVGQILFAAGKRVRKMYSYLYRL